jgi:predicted dienelactone hydrolase
MTARTIPTRIYLPAVDGKTATDGAPFPLFVWAHGLDATVDYFDAFLRTIASHGYVVVAPTFPLTHLGAEGGTVFDDYVNQPADVSFVIGKVLAAYGPDGRDGRGLVDPTRVGVGGHSLGAVTAMGLVSNTCCTDRRIDAAEEIDGSRLQFAGGQVDERGTPVLFIHGDADREFPVSESVAMYAASRPPKYLVVLHGLPHTPFGNPAAYTVILNATVNFLDAYLKHSSDARARLARDTPVPGLASLSLAPG